MRIVHKIGSIQVSSWEVIPAGFQLDQFSWIPVEMQLDHRWIYQRG